MLSVEWGKEIVELTDTLRHPEKEITTRSKRIVENRDNIGLRSLTQINEKIAT